MWIGVAFVAIIQLILPIFIVGKMVFDILSTGLSGQIPSVQRAVIHDDALSYTSFDMDQMGDIAGQDVEHHLSRISLDDPDAEPQVVAFQAPIAQLQLASMNGALWIAKDHRVWRTEGDEVVPLSNPIDVMDMNINELMFFEAEGQSHMLVADYLNVLTAWKRVDDRWEQQWALPPGPESIDTLDVVATEDTVHVFISDYDSPIFHHVIEGRAPVGSWNAIAPAAYSWAASVDGGQPILFRLESDDENSRLIAYRGPQGWQQVASEEFVFASEIGADVWRSDAVVILDGLGEAIEIVRINGDGFETVHEHGRNLYDTLVWGFAASQLVPLLFVLAFVLLVGNRIRSHRTLDYTRGKQTRRFATLPRRAIAKAIDSAVVLCGPLAAYVTGFISLSSDEPALWLCAAWGMVSTLVFAYLEGTRGWTPGKKLLRLRVVGLDLQPIGFGSALLRQILSAVDAMFGWQVGLAVAALDVRFQRISDQAAHSIVLEDSVDQNPI